MNAKTSSVDFCRQIFEVLPMPIFVVDSDLKVLDHNSAAHELLAVPVESGRGLLGGHILHCLNAIAHNEGCGQTPYCAKCGLRNSLAAAVKGMRTVHTTATMRLVRGGVERQCFFRITVAPLPGADETCWLIAMDDRTEQAELEELFPICSSCGEPRADEKFRAKAEAYLRHHRDNDYSEILCAGCRERLLGYRK